MDDLPLFTSRRPGPRLDDIALGVLSGYLLDRWLGDPARHHPVAGFGSYALRLERPLYAPTRTRGVAFAAASVLPWVALTSRGASWLGRQGRPGRLARGVLTAGVTWAALGGRSLEREALAVSAHLEADDLPAARTRIRSLVGRDTSQADASDLARAVVESLAENQSDAVAATLVWGALGGPGGVVAHRCLNTLDAMVGYRNDRYRDFGWASARLDDVMNYLPSRVSTGVTIALAGLTDGPQAARRVWRTVRRDAPQHPSPNAGPVESAAAAALGVRLGGVNRYGDVVEDRGQLGDGAAVTVADVPRAVTLTRRVGAGVLVTAMVTRWAARRGIRWTAHRARRC